MKFAPIFHFEAGNADRSAARIEFTKIAILAGVSGVLGDNGLSIKLIDDEAENIFTIVDGIGGDGFR